MNITSKLTLITSIGLFSLATFVFGADQPASSVKSKSSSAFAERRFASEYPRSW
jgi:hypothetical protein